MFYRWGGDPPIRVDGVTYASSESYLAELNKPIQYDYADFVELENKNTALADKIVNYKITLKELKKVIDGRDALLAKYKNTIRDLREQIVDTDILIAKHVERKETIVRLRQQLKTTNERLIQRMAELMDWKKGS